MKFILLLFLCGSYLGSYVASSPLGDGHADIETTENDSDIEEDWQLIPNADGKMHLVNINQIEAAPTFNAWEEMIFILFTRNNINAGQIITLNNAAQLSASQFNPAHQTRFVIHGWNANGNAAINTMLRAAYLDRGDFNVIVVDWSAGAVTDNYVAARFRVADAGHVVGQFIDFLNYYTGMPFTSVTVIGHSLGAHVAGFAGKTATRGVVQNVVALDTAMPLFTINNPETRVHYTDAVYVESIHTDAGRLGFDEPIGDAAFYPNWGRNLPGCGPDLLGSCGHGRVLNLFAESVINPNAFYATRCSGWPAIQAQSCPSTGPSMAMGGEPVNQGANGVFFLTINEASPFGQGWRP